MLCTYKQQCDRDFKIRNVANNVYGFTDCIKVQLQHFLRWHGISKKAQLSSWKFIGESFIKSIICIVFINVIVMNENQVRFRGRKFDRWLPSNCFQGKKKKNPENLLNKHFLFLRGIYFIHSLIFMVKINLFNLKKSVRLIDSYAPDFFFHEKITFVSHTKIICLDMYYHALLMYWVYIRILELY